MIPQMTGQIWAIWAFLCSAQNLVPPLLRQIFIYWWLSFKDYFNNNCYVEIPQFVDEGGFLRNDVYRDALIYYSNLQSAAHAPKQNAFKAINSSILVLAPDYDQLIHDDSFRSSVRVCWTQHSILQKNSDKSTVEKKFFVVKVNKQGIEFLEAYFEHVATKAEELRVENRELTITTNAQNARSGECFWISVPFKHPSTFNTLALDPINKRTILSDLNRFKQSKRFYRRIGRAWKRGYLLYGPPGTGKTSLIAAIANYMKYDVYDLDLTQVNDNVDLRRLLAHTKEKSIIIIEDIDCSLDLRNTRALGSEQKRNGRVSLSGLLNFTDGLWSCCGEERLFIFTTNQKEHLDPALLRCGRMDMHFSLSFCNFPVFKNLALNYLSIEDHPLYSAVDDKINAGAQMTPSEVIQVLNDKVDDPNKALTALIASMDVNATEILMEEAPRQNQSAHMSSDPQFSYE